MAGEAAVLVDVEGSIMYVARKYVRALHGILNALRASLTGRFWVAYGSKNCDEGRILVRMATGTLLDGPQDRQWICQGGCHDKANSYIRFITKVAPLLFGSAVCQTNASLSGNLSI